MLPAAGSPRRPLIYDISPKGEAKLITRGAQLLQGSGGVKFALYPTDWRIEKGHRIGILLSGSDDSWFATNNTGTSVVIESGKLSVPFLRYQRHRNLAGRGANWSNNPPLPTAVNPTLFKDRTARSEMPPRLRDR